MIIHHDYSLLGHNTFGIEARCRRFIEYASLSELDEALKLLREEGETQFLHIGGGSNLLFTKDFDGTILHSAITGRETVADDGEHVELRVGAGENWDRLVEHCTAEGLHGLENLSLIPGEAGASAVQNIGAYGTEAGDFIVRVETVETATSRRRTFTNRECEYAYRHSIFKGKLAGHYIITHVTFGLHRTFAPDLGYAALRRELEARGISLASVTPTLLRELIVSIRQSKLPDPAVTGSAGSFFMNPVIPEERFKALQAQYPDLPHYPAAGGVKIPAGWLIEQCGWKGKRAGKAGVHDRQALVLINCGGATGADIVQLSDTIRRDVRERFGIEIRPEVYFV